LAGTVLAAEGRRAVGVEPEAGDDVRRSLETGERIRIDVPRTIADGLQTTSPGAVPFAILQGRAEVVTVSDGELVDAMRFLFERPRGALDRAAAGGGELDRVLAPVVGLAVAHDQPVPLELFDRRRGRRGIHAQQSADLLLRHRASGGERAEHGVVPELEADRL